MGILGGADGSDKLSKVSTIQIWAVVEQCNARRVPGARYKTAGPERRLGVLSAWNVRQDVGDYLGGEEDFAAGVGGNDRWDGRRRRILHGRFLTAETYWNLQRLGHLYIPVGLSIESHGGDLREFEVELAGPLGAEKTQKVQDVQGRANMLIYRKI